jgi:hypothetical protein
MSLTTSQTYVAALGRVVSWHETDHHFRTGQINGRVGFPDSHRHYNRGKPASRGGPSAYARWRIRLHRIGDTSAGALGYSLLRSEVFSPNRHRRQARLKLAKDGGPEVPIRGGAGHSIHRATAHESMPTPGGHSIVGARPVLFVRRQARDGPATRHAATSLMGQHGALATSDDQHSGTMTARPWLLTIFPSCCFLRRPESLMSGDELRPKLATRANRPRARCGVSPGSSLDAPKENT